MSWTFDNDDGGDGGSDGGGDVGGVKMFALTVKLNLSWKFQTND